MPKKSKRLPRKKRNVNRQAGGRPTLILKAHALINQNITGVNAKQINIAPSASVFGADVL
jgi:hypothetical protein